MAAATEEDPHEKNPHAPHIMPQDDIDFLIQYISSTTSL